MKSRAWKLIYILSVIAFTLLGLDALLWHIDWLGIRRYADDFITLQAHSIPALDGIRYLPVPYDLEMYTLTIGLDGLRVVPNTRFSRCRIAFIGDSVTFGMGASETFVNLLAQDMKAMVINAGLPGYNVENIALELQTIQADGYIWLIIQNDAEPMATYQQYEPLPPATALYLINLYPRSERIPDTDYLFTYADTIFAHENLLAFIFADERLTERMTERYPQIIVLPQYTGKVSRFDRHPNNAGMAEIAAAMLSYIIEFVEGICD